MYGHRTFTAPVQPFINTIYEGYRRFCYYITHFSAAVDLFHWYICWEPCLCKPLIFSSMKCFLMSRLADLPPNWRPSSYSTKTLSYVSLNARSQRHWRNQPGMLILISISVHQQQEVCDREAWGWGVAYQLETWWCRLDVTTTPQKFCYNKVSE